MPYVGALTFDAADAVRLAGFWAAVLGLPVPEPKTAKNRCHPDLHTDDLTRELNRVRALGAEEVERHDGPAGRWVVLRDVEGNEFCLVQDED